MNAEAGVFRRAGWSITDTWLMSWRNVLYYVRNPYWISLAVVQPIMFTLLFVFVFGGAIDTPDGGPYVNYLIPGIILQTVIFSSLGSGINIAEDMQKGTMDRFRSLPISRGTVLSARTLSDIVRNGMSALIIAGVGFLVGFRFRGDLVDAVLAFLLIVLMGLAFSWIAATIGLLVRTTQAAEMAGFTWSFPLVFASSIFVPTSTMPDWLRSFADANPISHGANAARAYSAGMDPGNAPLFTLLWCAFIIVLFRTLAVWRFRRLA
jgi:ABC transporter DrrB family efflux protein